ncbi:MAG: ABC transporter permease [Clostridia bacterium]|nr:ABC transporter permease [Clostridia bacterium]
MKDQKNNKKTLKVAAEASSNEKKKRDPIIHITKRGQLSTAKSIGIRAAAIFAALLVGGLISVLVTGKNPIDIYVSIFKGAFGNTDRAWITFQEIAVLLGISLAVTPAFKMKFWNTGAEGQVLIGCLVTAACMFWIGGSVPEWALIIIMLLSSVAAGILWGVIPAFFKAFWGTNETLFTLMMNYVAIQLVESFLKIADKSGSNTVGPNILVHGWVPDLFGVQYLLNIVIVGIMCVLMHVYLKKTKQGYEIAVVGESENTARYVGINVKKVIIRTMAISGAICGLVGFLLVGATSHSIDADLVSGRGFTAIMVSWLAKFNPIVMIFTAFLLVFLDLGAGEMSTTLGLNESYGDILTGIILFFIIGCEFFIQYKINVNKKHKLFAKKEDKEAAQ